MRQRCLQMLSSETRSSRPGSGAPLPSTMRPRSAALRLSVTSPRSTPVCGSRSREPELKRPTAGCSTSTCAERALSMGSTNVPSARVSASCSWPRMRTPASATGPTSTVQRAPAHRGAPRQQQRGTQRPLALLRPPEQAVKRRMCRGLELARGGDVPAVAVRLDCHVRQGAQGGRQQIDCGDVERDETRIVGRALTEQLSHTRDAPGVP